MKKKISLILVLCMMVTLLLPTAKAAEEDPSLAIAGFNITFKDSVFLKYAVKAENADDVRLLVWTEPQDEYTYGTQQYALTSSKQTINTEIFDVFTFKDLTAKQMTDDVYARAYTEKGGIGFYSDVSKYSILEYAYSITGKTGTATTDQKLLDVISTMLAYGAAAQQYYNGGKGYHLERLATAEYYQITVVGGTMESGFTQQLCPAGASVVLVAPEENSEGDGFDHWENSAGESVGTTATLTITVGAANETYTAKYEPVKATKPTPSEGLELEVDGEEALVIGLGTCADDFVILPEEYQSVPVTTIDTAAFAGEEFTSIYIPITVTTIAKKAFNNAELTIVYYEGTKAQWDEIEIGANNDPLNNAAMHYSSYGPAPVTGFTVTFKDYDGTTLKTQTVKSGESATAPEDPIRDGYTFIRWNGDYTNITADTVITAEYVEGTGPMHDHTVQHVAEKQPTSTEDGNISYWYCSVCGKYFSDSACENEITYEDTVIPKSVTNYKVTFKNYDGTVIATQETPEGGTAELPPDPVKAGTTFLGWRGNYTKVTGDTEVTAVFSDEKNVLVIESVSGMIGDTVDVLISIDGTVKTCGFDINVMYDENLQLVSYDDDQDLDIVVNPSAYNNGIKLNFSGSSDKTKQRDIIVLSFKIKDTAKTAMPITMSVNSIKEILNFNPADTQYVIVDGAVFLNK